MGKQNEIIISGVGGQGLILCGTLMAQAAVLHDHRQATLSSEYSASQQGIDITKISRELGNTAVANIVTLGIVAGVLKVVTAEGVLNAIREFFGSRGEKTVALNIRAFETGYEIGRNMDGCHSGPVPLCG